MRVEVAVEAEEPSGVLLLRKAGHTDNVPVTSVSVGGVGEADLIVQITDKAQGLQVAVELLHPGHGHLGQGLHHVAHGHVVRKTHLVPELSELAATGQPTHPLRERAAEAEARTTSSKPEGDPLL